MVTKYKVKYRTPGFLKRWTRLDDVIGDGVEPAGSFRWFQRDNGSLVYIPLDSEVHFSPERDYSIRENIRKEAGQ